MAGTLDVGRGRTATVSGINVTPLVDAVRVLLMILTASPGPVWLWVALRDS